MPLRPSAAWLRVLSRRVSGAFCAQGRTDMFAFAVRLRGIAFRLSNKTAARPGRAEPEESPEALPAQDPMEGATPSMALEDIPDPEFRALMKSLRDSLQGKG